MNLDRCDICYQLGTMIFSGGKMRCAGSCQDNSVADNESPLQGNGYIFVTRAHMLAQMRLYREQVLRCLRIAAIEAEPHERDGVELAARTLGMKGELYG